MDQGVTGLYCAQWMILLRADQLIRLSLLIIHWIDWNWKNASDSVIQNGKVNTIPLLILLCQVTYIISFHKRSSLSNSVDHWSERVWFVLCSSRIALVYWLLYSWLFHLNIISYVKQWPCSFIMSCYIYSTSFNKRSDLGVKFLDLWFIVLLYLRIYEQESLKNIRYPPAAIVFTCVLLKW